MSPRPQLPQSRTKAVESRFRKMATCVWFAFEFVKQSLFSELPSWTPQTKDKAFRKKLPFWAWQAEEAWTKEKADLEWDRRKKVRNVEENWIDERKVEMKVWVKFNQSFLLMTPSLMRAGISAASQGPRPAAIAWAMPNLGWFFCQRGAKWMSRQILPPLYILWVFPSSSGNSKSMGEWG